MASKKEKEIVSETQETETMSDAVKQDILVRLLQIGHNGLGLSPKKWSQLMALREAALVMNDRCKEARSVLKANALTPTNAERVLKELGGVTVTDQTMHNNDGLLDKFFRTFEQAEMSGADARKEVKKLKEEVATLNQKVKQMESRDAECEDCKKEKADLEREVKELRQDKRDLEARLAKCGAKQKTVPMMTLDLTHKENQS